MKEEWRRVPVDPRYEVSNHGRIRGPNGILRGNKMKIGYVGVTFSNKHRRLVHRVVARAFLGEPPEGKTHVHHIDGNGRNNRVDNLMWVSHTENLRFAEDAGALNNAGENNGRAKLTWAEVRAIRAAERMGDSRAALASRFGVATQTIDRIVTWQTWKADRHLHEDAA